MYCQSCGREIGDARYCPICGAEQTQADGGSRDAAPYAPVYTVPDYNNQGGMYDTAGAGAYRSNQIEENVRNAFADPMFLAITVIATVNAILSIVVGNGRGQRSPGSGITITISVFPILFAIALWIIFASVRGQGRIRTTGFAMASGTLKAIRIIMWIVTIFVIVFAVLLILAGNYVIRQLDVSLPDFLNELGIEIRSYGYDIDIPQIGHLDVLSGAGAAIIAVVAVILIIVLIIINVVYYKKLHRFAKSVCISLKSGMNSFRCVRGAKNWLIVTAVFSFIAAAGTISGLRDPINALSMISSLLNGIAALLASSMIRTYFLNYAEY